jgi:2-polyprenyl-3-methyl-5-hydroxy-6-metoxy-1,4-benzoquinol methylase
MLICPDCARGLAAITAERCPHCGWELERADGVPVLLSEHDRGSQAFRDYASNYDVIAEDDLTETIQGREYLRIQHERFFRYLPELSGRNVCDLGIGQGLLLEHMRREGASEVTAIDIAMPYLRRYRDVDGIRVVLANAENIPFSEEFDVLVASAILEHVLNVGDFLLSAHRALGAGGRLVVTVPYKEDLTQYARARGCPYRFVHLRTFDRPLLRMMLAHAGFEVERLIFDGFHRFRLRSAFRRFRVPYRLTDKLLAHRYPTEEALHQVGTRLGTALFVPSELTAVARKV